MRWRRWCEWSKAWGEYLREYTQGWDGDKRVVPRDLRVLKARWRGSSKGLSGRVGGGMVTARGVGATAWASGPSEAWFLSFGRWEDKRTAMAHAKDFQDPRVLGDLLVQWPGGEDTLGFRDLAASEVWAGVQFATETLLGGPNVSWGQILTRITLAHELESREPQGKGVDGDEERLWRAPGGSMNRCQRS